MYFEYFVCIIAGQIRVDIPRFAELGVIPAMQAIHMSSDRPWAIERLGCTLDAAFGAFQEQILGSIKVGKYADFTVFSRDIMTIEQSEILQSEVVMTVVGGKIVYEKK